MTCGRQGPPLTIERILPVHEVRLLTYRPLGDCKVEPLINFNNAVLKDGLSQCVS